MTLLINVLAIQFSLVPSLHQGIIWPGCFQVHACFYAFYMHVALDSNGQCLKWSMGFQKFMIGHLGPGSNVQLVLVDLFCDQSTKTGFNWPRGF